MLRGYTKELFAKWKIVPQHERYNI